MTIIEFTIVFSRQSVVNGLYRYVLDSAYVYNLNQTIYKRYRCMGVCKQFIWLYMAVALSG